MLISLFVCHVITCLWAFVGLLGIECEGIAQCEALTREAEKRCTKGDLNCTNDLSVGLFESIGQGWTLSYKYIYWCSSHRNNLHCLCKSAQRSAHHMKVHLVVQPRKQTD